MKINTQGGEKFAPLTGAAATSNQITRRSKLAQAAIKEATPFGAVLHLSLVEKIALAHVALWLSQQDESTSAVAVRRTANEAIADIVSFYS